MDSKVRDDYSRKFGCYLLSTCWQKIVRKVGSWQVMGFIYFLNGISLREFQELKLLKTLPSKIGPGDKTLITFLRHASVNEGNRVPVIQSLLLDNIPSTERSEVERLIATVTSCPNSSVPLFSRETGPEFHSLVIGVFKSFARAFLQIKKRYEKLVSMDYQALAM